MPGCAVVWSASVRAGAVAVSRRRATIPCVSAEPSRDHVVRATVPWRSDQLTECGRPLSDVAAVISADELDSRITKFGEARAAFTVCTMCWPTAVGAPRWDADPVAVLDRETRRAQRAPGRREHQQLRTELLAIAALIDAHRQEYGSTIQGLASATDLAVRRRRR